MLTKHFVTRNSVLTDAMEDETMKSLYSMFVASFIMYLTYNLYGDYCLYGDVFRGWHSLMAALDKFHITISIWIGMYAIGCLIYLCFNFWARLRVNMMPKSKLIGILDGTCISALCVYYISSLRIVRLLSLWLELPMTSCCIVVYEQVRILMKVHSFIRHNASRVTSFKVHDDKVLILPTMSQFVYFTFAPTLIYSDDYPRTKNIRWKFALHCLLETIGCFLFGIMLHDRAVSPLFQEFGTRKFSGSELILAAFKATIPIALGLLIVHYMMLHTSQNFFAELLRFGDRQFYRRWWTCTSLFDFFRDWNVLVYDWSIMCLYRDVVQLLGPKRKLLAKLILFVASGIIHEIMMTYTMNVFFPMMSLELIISGIISALPGTSFGTTLFWCMWYTGASLLYSAYVMEYWARQNVPSKDESLLDFFTPRSLTCDCIQ